MNYTNLLVISILGFSSGLPLALIVTGLQGWLSVASVDIVTIGFLGLSTQPYALKFMWAPLLDRFALPMLGYRTGWIFAMQFGLVVAIIALSFCNPILSPLMIGLIALIISILSATQDIAFDAYRTEILSEEERGLGSICYVYGYRIAMIVAGAGSLVFSTYIGWQLTFIFMASLIALCSVITLFAKEPVRVTRKSNSLYEVVIEPFQEFISRDNSVILLLLVITYKLGEAFSMALTTPFLIQELHFSALDVGIISKTMGVIATLVGLSLGGVLINKLGLYSSLLWFGILQALTNIFYYFLAIMGHNYAMAAFTIFSDQLSSGMGTAAFMVLLMTVCNQKYTATQFALLSALAALGRVYVTPISGVYVASFGWQSFYLFSVVMCIPGLIFLYLLKNQRYLEDGYSLGTGNNVVEAE